MINSNAIKAHGTSFLSEGGECASRVTKARLDAKKLNPMIENYDMGRVELHSLNGVSKSQGKELKAT